MRTISVLIPCYNEEDNVVPMSNALVNLFEEQLRQYDYEILFIDNCSTDLTRDRLRLICSQNPRVRAIFNAKNFGQFNSPYYGMLQTKGDCVISMCCDFQDPIDVIPQFVKAWEEGYRIVCGIKASSKENGVMRFLRTCYYKVIKKLSQVEQIEHFTGFGLYDKAFIEVLRKLDDPTPFLRGIVAELGFKRKDIQYEQQKRRAGKTHNNWYTLYDAAMLSFTSYTKFGLRVATIGGFCCSAVGFCISVYYFIKKILRWDEFQAGMAPVTIGVFTVGAVQMFFTGLLGEYVMNINTRVMKRPLVVEEERINFND